MATKKTVHQKQPSSEKDAAGAIEDQVSAAEEELHLAREAFEQAQQHYAELRRQAAEDGEGTEDDIIFGDLLDRTLHLVKKHPGLGVAAAAAVGFVLGRLFRRW